MDIPKRQFRPLTADEVLFTIEAEDEDMPVRGNLVDSGDPEQDRLYEDEVIERLDAGDIWAWCTVRVSATWEGTDTFVGGDLVGVTFLGECSYAGERDFCANGGYLEQMEQEALDDLNERLSILYAMLHGHSEEAPDA